MNDGNDDEGSSEDVTSEPEVLDESGRPVPEDEARDLLSKLRVSTNRWRQVWFGTGFGSSCTYFHGEYGYSWISGPNNGKEVVWDKLESCSWNGCDGPFDLNKYPHRLSKTGVLTHGFTDFCNGENSRDGKHDKVYSVLRFTLGSQTVQVKRRSKKGCGEW